MATKTKAGADGLALPPVPAPFDADAHERADLARIADDLHALNEAHARLRGILGREPNGYEVLAWWVRGLDGRWVPNPLARHHA